MLERTIRSSRVQPNYRITPTRKVREKLNADIGDIVNYIEDEKETLFSRKVNKDLFNTSRKYRRLHNWK